MDNWQYNLLDRASLIVAALTGVIPLSITGFLLSRGLVSKDPYTGAFYGLAVFCVAFSLFQLVVVNREIGKFLDRRFDGDTEPPAPRFKLLFGMIVGVIAWLAVAALTMFLLIIM